MISDRIEKNIEIMLNNENITNDCNISNDLITYVPSDRLNNGSYELMVKITNDREWL